MSDVALVTPGCGAVEKKMYCMAVSRATERSCAAAAELKTMQGGGRGEGWVEPRLLQESYMGGGVVGEWGGGGGLILSPLSSHHLSLTWL